MKPKNIIRRQRGSIRGPIRQAVREQAELPERTATPLFLTPQSVSPPLFSRPHPFLPHIFIMSRIPKDQMQKLQMMLKKTGSGGGFGGGFGGFPSGGGQGGGKFWATVAAIGIGSYVASDTLFNGRDSLFRFLSGSIQ